MNTCDEPNKLKDLSCLVATLKNLWAEHAESQAQIQSELRHTPSLSSKKNII